MKERFYLEGETKPNFFNYILFQVIFVCMRQRRSRLSEEARALQFSEGMLLDENNLSLDVLVLWMARMS